MKEKIIVFIFSAALGVGIALFVIPFFNHMLFADSGIAPYPFGKVENQVLFVNLKSMQDEETWIDAEKLQQAETLFNGESNSLHHYMQEISLQEIDVTSYFYGEEQNGFQPSKSKEYYINALETGKSDAELEEELLREVLAQFDEQKALKEKTNAQLDTNQDGFLDNVTFVLRGRKSEHHALIWPHQYSMQPQDGGYPSVETKDGTLQVKDYIILLAGDDEWGSGGIFDFEQDSIGVTAHEYLHLYGVPDLYHNYYYDEKSESFQSVDDLNGDPLGIWDVMNYTSKEHPQNPLVFTNLYYTPWKERMPQIETLTEGSHHVTLSAVDYRSEEGNYAKILKVPTTVNEKAKTEYFMVEFRSQNTYWDTSLPASGLLVYRINTTATTDSGTPAIDEMCSKRLKQDRFPYCGNAFGPLDEVFIFRPNADSLIRGNSSYGLDENLNDAALSLESGQTSLGKRLEEIRAYDPDQFQDTIYFSDGSNSGIVISNVTSASGDTISFDVDIPYAKQEEDKPMIASPKGLDRWHNDVASIEIPVLDTAQGLQKICVTSKAGNKEECQTYAGVKETTFAFHASQNGIYEIEACNLAKQCTQKEIVIDKIDLQAPIIQKIEAVPIYEWLLFATNRYQIHLDIQEEQSKIETIYYQIVENDQSIRPQEEKSAWQCIQPEETMEFDTNGFQTILVYVVDEAGNASSVASVDIKSK